MVWFTFTFLLGIPNSEDKMNKPSKKAEKFNVEMNYTEIEVTKPNFFCHIEYVLFPNEAQKFIDVVCWDEVAKIYCENATSAIKPFVIENLSWIHFRVNHKLDLSNDDIKVLHSHVVKITISLGNKKIGQQARADNTKKFYCPLFEDGENEEEDNEEEYFTRKQIFQPVSEALENLKAVSFFKEHLTSQQQLYLSLDTTIETSEHYKKLFNELLTLSNEYNNETIQRIPTAPYTDLPPIINLLAPSKDDSTDQNPTTAKTPQKKSNTKSDKKFDEKSKKTSKKTKELENDSIVFFIPGESILSGKNIFENCIKYNSKELPFVFCLTRIKDVLSRFQAEHFNPLSVSLNHCKYLPSDDLKKHGVTYLKFQYVMFDKYLVESNEIPIDSDIKINYTRTFLTDTADKTQLIYFLQTGGLKINLLGNLKQETEIQPEVYDEKRVMKESRLFRRTTITTPSDKPGNFFLIGTGFLDLSSVLSQPHILLLKCNLQIPHTPIDVSCANDNFSNFITLYEFCKYRRKKREIKLSKLATTCSPVLTVSVRLSHSLLKVYQNVIKNCDLLNRLFTVIYDKNFAKYIINIIEHEAGETLEPVDYYKNNINVKRPLTFKHMGIVLTLETAKKDKMTGFLIDCSTRIFIYVEGPLYGTIQQIWALVSCMKSAQGSVLYDSSLIFTERLYGNFFKYGGFLKVNIQSNFKKWPKLEWCKRCCMPELTLRALNCLNMLVTCRSIKAAIHNNLFPHPDSLCALALQIGAPIQWHKK